MERLFRRAGLRLAMSQGFHPKPRMSFPSALALGIEGLDEVMEIEVAEECAAEAIRDRLAPHAVSGLEFRSVRVLSPGDRKARLRAASYELPVPASRRGAAAERIAGLLAATAVPLHRPGKRPVDLRGDIEQLALREGVLAMRLRLDRAPCAGPRDVRRALGLDDLEREGACLRRTRVEVET